MDTSSEKSLIRKVKSYGFTKELKRFEFETKFDISKTRLSSFQILKKVRIHLRDDPRYLLCEFANGDKLNTNVIFFASDNAEYSVFKYRGVKMVKIKKHKILNRSPFPIFKNQEELVIDKQSFLKIPEKSRKRFGRHNYKLENLNKFLSEKKYLINFGKMTKNRVKDFVFDKLDGRIYALAIAFCSSNNKIQKQLEVEYAGFLPGMKPPKKDMEKKIISGTEELSNRIFTGFRSILIPSIERKFEFVKQADKKHG